MKKESYRTTMPFTDGLSPVTDKVRKNQPQLGGGPYEGPRSEFDKNMGGDHKYIGPDPDGINYAVGGLFHGEWSKSDPDIPYSSEVVVVDDKGDEHVYTKKNYESVMMEWNNRKFKAIYRRERKEVQASTIKIAQSSSIVPLIADVMPGCFKIESESVRYGKKEIGSCFSVSDGKFVTCAHTISKRGESPDDVSVFLVEGGNRHRATVDSVDYDMDLAMVSCDLIRHTPLKMKSISSMEVGAEIVCIGSPFGYDNNISRGIISSVNRVIDKPGAISYFFIDLSVFPGNSGGPVIDVADGSVIGVAAVIVDSVGNYGLNAAIPSDYVIRRFSGIFSDLK